MNHVTHRFRNLAGDVHNGRRNPTATATTSSSSCCCCPGLLAATLLFLLSPLGPVHLPTVRPRRLSATQGRELCRTFGTTRCTGIGLFPGAAATALALAAANPAAAAWRDACVVGIDGVLLRCGLGSQGEGREGAALHGRCGCGRPSCCWEGVVPHARGCPVVLVVAGVGGSAGRGWLVVPHAGVVLGVGGVPEALAAVVVGLGVVGIAACRVDLVVSVD
mmetsp:Transcript_25281/g.72983  ORF Transcript_25281/g.72983 Transcript_25281/m.72983 type:complete len:220 (+) Transcript_25281:1541-2200(+)